MNEVNFCDFIPTSGLPKSDHRMRHAKEKVCYNKVFGADAYFSCLNLRIINNKDFEFIQMIKNHQNYCNSFSIMEN